MVREQLGDLYGDENFVLKVIYREVGIWDTGFFAFYYYYIILSV